jgi:galactokinase
VPEHLPAEVRAFAPGRVNLIGEHTDYNQGLALPFATTEGVRVSARALGEPRIEVVACDLDERDEFALEDRGAAEGWRAFVRGAVAELTSAGYPLRGAALSFTGTLPQGGGLSSSAALEVSLCLALIALAGSRVDDRIALAQLCRRIENEWVGAQTGLLDQLASLCGERDQAVRIDFASLEVEQLPLELGEHRLVALDSGEQHSLAAGGYNERRSECERACSKLGVSSLRDASLQAAGSLPAPLDRRVRHVVTENQRVEEAVEALRRRDLETVGELLDASHASQRDDYEVSTPAVEQAVRALKRAGALGARLIGGGFGGHVLGLLPPGAEPPPGSTEVAPGPGAHLL